MGPTELGMACLFRLLSCGRAAHGIVHPIAASYGMGNGHVFFLICARDGMVHFAIAFHSKDYPERGTSRPGSGDEVAHLHEGGARPPIKTWPRPRLPLVINFFLAVSLSL